MSDRDATSGRVSSLTTAGRAPEGPDPHAYPRAVDADPTPRGAPTDRAAPPATAIVLAGGSAARLGAGENKAFLDLGGVPILGWSLVAFHRAPGFDRIVIVTRAVDHDRAAAVAAELGVTSVVAIVTGGTTRHASERAGLAAVADDVAARRIGVIAIHDAARPFIRQRLLERILTDAASVGGAIPVLPVDQPFLVRRGDGPDAAVPVATSDLRRAQTPQAFRAAELVAAYRRADEVGTEGVDTAETVERFGALTITAIPGDLANAKITYAADLTAARARATDWDEHPLRR